MTKAEETIKLHTTDFGFVMTDAMSIHAQEFAEWCEDNGWVYHKFHKVWCKNNERKTTSELYTIFNNQNK